MDTIVENYDGRQIGVLQDVGGGNMKAIVYPRYGGCMLVGEYDSCCDECRELRDGMYTGKKYRGSSALASFVYSAYDRSC